MSLQHSCHVSPSRFAPFPRLEVLRGVLWGLPCVREPVRAGTRSPWPAAGLRRVSIKHSSKRLSRAECPGVRHSFVLKATVICISKACKECPKKRGRGKKKREGGREFLCLMGSCSEKQGEMHYWSLVLNRASVFLERAPSPMAVRGIGAGAGTAKESLWGSSSPLGAARLHKAEESNGEHSNGGFKSCCWMHMGSGDCVIEKIPQLGFWESREYEFLFLQ